MLYVLKFVQMVEAVLVIDCANNMREVVLLTTHVTNCIFISGFSFSIIKCEEITIERDCYEEVRKTQRVIFIPFYESNSSE